MTNALLIAGLASAAGCGTGSYDAERTQHPSLTFPHRFAEGTDQGKPRRSQNSAPSRKPLPAHSRSAENQGSTFDATTSPEPAPLNARLQWEYEFAYDSGAIDVTRVTRREFAEPVVTARRMGRFAVELWIGRELIDRVRFDFPLLAGEQVPEGPATPIDAPVRFAPRAQVQTKLLVPASERATRAELVDSSTGTRTPLAWPPDAPIEPITPGPAQNQPDP